MKELEVKILDVDVPQLTTAFGALGATLVYDGPLRSVYYDYTNRRLSREGKSLRLREGPDLQLALKRKISKNGVKARLEHEIVFSDMETARAIIHGLGLVEQYAIEKHRASYRLDDVHFELDTIPGLPTFLEIEATTRRRLKDAVGFVGYSWNLALPWSNRDVIAHYARR